MNICSKLPEFLQDVDAFVSSSEQIWRNVPFRSPMDPLLLMGAVIMRVQTAD